jgi:putative ABC transport system permease protein
MIRATWRSLLQRKLRLILSGLAVVLGVMFVSGSFVLTDTMSRSFEGLFTTVFSSIDVQVTAKPEVLGRDDDGEEIRERVLLTAEDVAKVRAVDGVADAWGAVGEEGARLIGADGKTVPSGGPPRFGINWTGKDSQIILREGHAPEADDQIVINAKLARDAGVKVGDRVGVLTREPRREFELVGIFGYTGGKDTLGGTQVIAFTNPVAQRLMLGEDGKYSTIVVRAPDDLTPAALRDRIAAELGDRYEVRTGEQLAAEISADFAQELSFFNNFLLGFAGVALFVGVFLIINTFSIIIAQRTRELALMRAMGASRRQVIGSVLLEAAVIGLLASIIGLGAGIGVGVLLAKIFGSIGGGDLELAGIGVPSAAIIGAFTVGILVTVIAAILPALRAARIPPVAALQEAATPDRPLTKITIVGGVVFVGGATTLGFGLSGVGDATLWLILAGVLFSFIGVALLTPLLARPIVAVIGRIFSWSIPGKLGRLNSGRNPRRTAITAAALMVGIALVTGVTTMVTSATTSFDKLLKKQVTADLIVSSEEGGPIPPTVDQATMDAMAAVPGVAMVAGFLGDPTRVNDDLTWVTAVTDLPPLRDMLSLKAEQGSLDALGEGQAIVDSETAKELGLSVGQTVTMQFSNGEPHTLTVVGIYATSDLTDGWVVSDDYLADFEIKQPLVALIKLADGASAEDVKNQVTALLANNPEMTVVDRSEFVDQQAGDLNSLLLMIQVLLALAILIAVLGIINTLALSVLERTRELGLLRAVGLNRIQTMRMVTVEAVVISVFGAVLGLAVGAGLGAAVVQALKDEGITDLAFPWAQMGTYLVVAALVGVLAAVLPAIRAARTNVLAAIAYE